MKGQVRCKRISHGWWWSLGVMGLALAWGLRAVPFAAAHCDSMDGPVVSEARTALEQGQVTAVLKWIRQEDEPAIREAFAQTLAVRKLGSEARKLADQHFFETLVRLHRAGEGESYTGLLPSGTPLESGIAQAEQAINDDSVNVLARQLAHQVEQGITVRFEQLQNKRTHKGESVEAGREFVQAYVQYIHYVEQLHVLAGDAVVPHRHAPAQTSAPHPHP